MFTFFLLKFKTLHHTMYVMNDAEKKQLVLKVGKRIKELREAQNLSQPELGARLGGIDKQAISRYENRGIDPKISTLNKMAKALRVSLRDFVDFDKKIDFNDDAIDSK